MVQDEARRERGSGECRCVGGLGSAVHDVYVCREHTHCCQRRAGLMDGQGGAEQAAVVGAAPRSATQHSSAVPRAACDRARARCRSPLSLSTGQFKFPASPAPAGHPRRIVRTLVASCLRGALPPVLLRAVCFVRAIVVELWGVWGVGRLGFQTRLYGDDWLADRCGAISIVVPGARGRAAASCQLLWQGQSARRRAALHRTAAGTSPAAGRKPPPSCPSCGRPTKAPPPRS